MNCVRAKDCSLSSQLRGGSRLLKVLRHLYCEFDPARCARMRIAATDRDVPPDLMPDGYSTSEVAEPGL